MGKTNELPAISDSEYQEFLQQLRSALDDVMTTVAGFQPSIQQNLSWEQANLVGIWVRVTHLYDATSELIEKGHVEAAMIVGRSFLVDALTLRYLALRPALLRSNIIRWLRRSLREEKALAKEGLSVGVEGVDPNDVESQLRELGEMAKALPGARKAFPEEKDMARNVGDPEAYWSIKLCSNIVHTTQMAVGRLMQQRDGLLIAEAFVSPTNLYWMTDNLISGLWAALESTGKLMNWPVVSPQTREESASRLTELEERANRLQGIDEADSA